MRGLALCLVRPILVEDLPLCELLKLDGPGSIHDENLQLEVFNGTPPGTVREITIGLTLGSQTRSERQAHRSAA